MQRNKFSIGVAVLMAVFAGFTMVQLNAAVQERAGLQAALRDSVTNTLGLYERLHIELQDKLERQKEFTAQIQDELRQQQKSTGELQARLDRQEKLSGELQAKLSRQENIIGKLKSEKDRHFGLDKNIFSGFPIVISDDIWRNITPLNFDINNFIPPYFKDEPWINPPYNPLPPDFRQTSPIDFGLGVR